MGVMKIFFPLLLILFCIGMVLNPRVVSAHLSGPPYVKLDGIYAQTNVLMTYTTPTHFSIGTDLATPSAYIVNRPIIFEIDEQFFPNPYAYGAEKVQPMYRWNFGDDTPKVEGRSVTHTYQKPGTYVASLEAKFPGKVDEYAGINPIQINILPYEGYVLPKAVIRVNNKQIKDPTRDILEIRGKRSIQFDASASEGNIVSYTWDFSDASTASGKAIMHQYKNSDYFPMFPVLRVVDDNNIVSDTFAFLDAPQSNNIFINFVGWIEDIVFGVQQFFTK
jgi:PKD repeat protein